MEGNIELLKQDFNEYSKQAKKDGVIAIVKLINEQEIEILLFSVIKEKRGQGLGSEYFKGLLEIIDEHSLMSTLLPFPMSRDCPLQSLKLWYRKYGFKPLDDIRMMRHPEVPK